MIKYKIHFGSAKAITILRRSIGVIFIWFGMVKFFVGLSPAEDLASSTICTLTAHIFPQASCMPVLAIFESLIGISLLSGKFLKWALGLLFLHMLGTFSTFFIFPEQMFSHFPFVLTMKGQYVMKNIIILAAGISIWISTRKMVPIRDDPKK
ncbi:hypothetical protein C7S20_15325 [Christiangramia fulva]|uniref:Doxx family protein n=1 Tax=Christiangramia fulva TaxID=2126553 RepID=A0A2R3Z8G3_9FLAO|nr:hypothetical protein [Christiangramia fulva]AVR46525.1 hypothetical protein C7S20_15325 [Christiangramia fulva]